MFSIANVKKHVLTPISLMWEIKKDNALNKHINYLVVVQTALQ